MQQCIFMLLFFTGITPLILSLPRKFYLIKQEKTWSEALAYCRANHFDLASIDNDDDMVQLQNVSQSQSFTSGAWIGLYDDINSWHWSYENIPLGNMTAWDLHQPDDHDGDEECVVINKGLWFDMSCANAYPVVCFDDQTYGTGRYVYASSKMTWRDAQIYCRQKYTDLASVRDEVESEAIESTISTENVWFGLFRDSWKWVDRSNVSSVKWKNGHPDNKGPSGNCGFLINGLVENEVCSVKMFFFCSSVITERKQVIKLKVRSEQDVNDPDIKAAILNKVEQKLKEHGLAENSMVTWRKQLDGEVFYKEIANEENNNRDSGEI